MHNEHLLKTPGHAGVMVLKDGQSHNYGTIRTLNGNFVYKTGKGLKEIHKPETADEKKLAEMLLKKTETELIASGHIAIVPLSEIQTVLR